MKKIEKAVEKAVLSYISSDIDWDSDDAWMFEASDDNDVKDEIIAYMDGGGIETDEDFSRFDKEIYDEEYGRLAAKAQSVANAIIKREFNKRKMNTDKEAA